MKLSACCAILAGRPIWVYAQQSPLARLPFEVHMTHVSDVRIRPVIVVNNVIRAAAFCETSVGDLLR